MSRHNLNPLRKMEIANRLLAYFQKAGIKHVDSSYPALLKASNAIEEELFDAWKAYALLRETGRLELNCPNGRNGFHINSYAPLAKTAKIKPANCDVRACIILKAISKLPIFKDEVFISAWAEARHGR